MATDQNFYSNKRDLDDGDIRKIYRRVCDKHGAIWETIQTSTFGAVKDACSNRWTRRCNTFVYVYIRKRSGINIITQPMRLTWKRWSVRMFYVLRCFGSRCGVMCLRNGMVVVWFGVVCAFSSVLCCLFWVRLWCDTNAVLSFMVSSHFVFVAHKIAKSWRNSPLCQFAKWNHS